MKQTIQRSSKKIDINKSAPSSNPEKQHNWKFFIFFIPLASKGSNVEKSGNKGWLEVLLLCLKVIAALVALAKAIGWVI